MRLRGLPFSSTEQDVLAFFAQHDIVDRIMDGPNAVNLLLRSNGRPSGQAVVQMKDRVDAELAQRILGGQWMGSRYIEVFLYGEDGQSESGPAGAGGPQGAASEATAAVAAASGLAGLAGPGALGGGVSPFGGLPGMQLGATPQEVAAAAIALQALSSPWPWGAGLGVPSPGVPGLGMPPVPAACGCGQASWEALFEFLGPEASLAALANSGAFPGAGHLAYGGQMPYPAVGLTQPAFRSPAPSQGDVSAAAAM